MRPKSVFKLGGVALEAWFLRGVGFTILVSGLSPAGAFPSLFLHLGFLTHGDVRTLFCNNVERTDIP